MPNEIFDFLAERSGENLLWLRAMIERTGTSHV